MVRLGSFSLPCSSPPTLYLQVKGSKATFTYSFTLTQVNVRCDTWVIDVSYSPERVTLLRTSSATTDTEFGDSDIKTL